MTVRSSPAAGEGVGGERLLLGLAVGAGYANHSVQAVPAHCFPYYPVWISISALAEF